MRKKYEDLSLIDNFMINAMAADPEKAEPAFRVILSVLLQRKINRVSVTAESLKRVKKITVSCRICL